MNSDRANRHDVLVAGLGAMGSAIAYHLARRGARVLGLDAYHPPHDHGSSHGQTRIIREAYFEHPAYVPLVQHAYTLWEQLQSASSLPLFLPTGGLMIGPPDGVLAAGPRRSAEHHRLTCEWLDAGALRQRHPALRVPDAWVAVAEPRAGILFPERCVEAHWRQAQAAGADLRPNLPLRSWSANAHSVTVATDAGAFQAQHLILSAGAWLAGLCPNPPLPIEVERQVQVWFRPTRSVEFQPEVFPIQIWEDLPGRFFYAFPDLGQGVKVAVHHEGAIGHPDRVVRSVATGELTRLADRVAPFLPGLGRDARDAKVCLYTNTPDGHFLLDQHPEYPRVTLVSPCSGHGFKFASAIGDIVARQCRGETPAFDLDLFRLGNRRASPR